MQIFLFLFIDEYNFPKRKETEIKTSKATEEEKENIPGKSNSNLSFMYLIWIKFVQWINVLVAEMWMITTKIYKSKSNLDAELWILFKEANFLNI